MFIKYNMFINTGYQITNTPNHIVAAYNTWPYQPPKSQWYQHVPTYYIDHLGNVQKWDKWQKPQTTRVCGGRFKGTPTRTGSFYVQNVII